MVWMHGGRRRAGTVARQLGWAALAVVSLAGFASATDLSRNLQYWRGYPGHSVWGPGVINWSLPHQGAGAPAPGLTAWRGGGHVGVFEANRAGTVHVANLQEFDTIAIQGDYSFVANIGTIHALLLSPEFSADGAFINVASGAAAHIHVQIHDGSSSMLTVDGDGVLTLHHADNTFSGPLTIADGATVVAKHGGSLGTGGLIAFDDSGPGAGGKTRLLDLDFAAGGTVAQTITGSGAVAVRGGNTVTFAAAGSDYSGPTRIGAATTLRAGADFALSDASAHRLAAGATLDIGDTRQRIAAVEGEAGSRVTLGAAGMLAIAPAAPGQGYAGALSGGGPASLVAVEDSFRLADIADYQGYVAAHAGILELGAAAGRDLAVRLDLDNTGAAAGYRLRVDPGRAVTLSSRGFGGYDTLEIASGRLVVDDAAARTLASGALLVNGPDAALEITADAALPRLDMRDATLVLASSGNGFGRLNLSDWNLTGTNTVRIDAGSLVRGGGADLFGYSAGRSQTLVSAGTVSGGGDIALADAAFTEAIRDDAGRTLGTARFGASHTFDPALGLLELDYRLEELAVAPGQTLVLDGDRAADASPVMAAALTGEGTFRFAGSKDLVVDPHSGAGPGAAFTGEVEVALGPGRSLLLGVAEALGEVRRLRLESGELDLGAHDQRLGAVSGAAGASLNLGSGGALALAGGDGAGAAFAGRVYGDKDIVKHGPGSQYFTNEGNHIGGGVRVEGGTLGLGGAVAGSLTVQDARLEAAGRLRVGGDARFTDAVVAGSYHIDGDLHARDTAFVLGAERGADGVLAFGAVTVDGTATLDDGVVVTLTDSGYRHFIRNPEGALDQPLFSAGSVAGNAGDLVLDAGIFGSAGLAWRDGDAGDRELAVAWVERDEEFEEAMIRAWAARGVDLSGPLRHSNLGAVAAETFADPALDGVGSLADAQAAFSGRAADQAAFESTRLLLFGTGMDGGAVLTGREARALGHALSGTGEKLAAEAGLSASQALGDALLGRARRPADAGDSPPAARRRVWAEALAVREEMDGRDGWDAGYRYAAGGFALGVEHSEEAFTAGAALTYLDGRLDNRAALGGETSLDAYGFGFYGAWRPGAGWAARGYAGYAWLDNDVRERGAVALDDAALPGWQRSDYASRAWFAGLEAAYEWQAPGDRLWLAPALGFRYTGYTAAAHDRRFVSDDGRVDWRGHAGRLDAWSARAPLGLTLGWRPTAGLSLAANLEYAYELNPHGPDGDIAWGGLSRPVRYGGRVVGRGIWNAGALVRYAAPGYDVSLGYRFTARSALRAHHVQASLGVEF